MVFGCHLFVNLVEGGDIVLLLRYVRYSVRVFGFFYTSVPVPVSCLVLIGWQEDIVLRGMLAARVGFRCFLELLPT